MLEKSDILHLLRKMGHDMRVPLNTIISTGDMLIQGTYDPLTPKQEKAVMRVQRNNYRLLAMLDDFMTYIKADAGELTLNPKPLDPRSQLSEWSDPVRQACEEKGIVFRLIIADQVPMLLTADETAVKKIIQALLWNALAHTSVGEIQVTSDWTAERQWLIAVKDSGSGIADSDLPHIFEPFWRGEARPQLPTAGAGLGLPLSLALAKLMGGDLTVQGTTGGSHFCVRVPADKAEKA
jgi:signal transduction histidine kinase